MALLKDTTVSGSLRATDSIFTTELQTQILNAPLTSNGTEYGPGTDGHILRSNGVSSYWGTVAASEVGAVQITGDTMTGNLAIDSLTNTPSLILYPVTKTKIYQGQFDTDGSEGSVSIGGWNNSSGTIRRKLLVQMPGNTTYGDSLDQAIRLGVSENGGTTWTGYHVYHSGMSGIGIQSGTQLFGGIFFGTCSTAAATTQKDVVCANFPSYTEAPPTGIMINVLFDNANTGAVANLTLKINNNTPTFPIKQINNSNNTVTNLSTAKQLTAGGIVTFVFTGEVWQVVGINYDSNSNTLLRTYHLSTDVELPLAAIGGVSNNTTASVQTVNSSHYHEGYGITATTNTPTLNPSTGKITVASLTITSSNNSELSCTTAAPIHISSGQTAAWNGIIGAKTKNGYIGIYTAAHSTNGNDQLRFAYSNGSAIQHRMTWNGATGELVATKFTTNSSNDYAEYRARIDAKPGTVVVDKDNGELEISSKRLMAGAQVISDTFGFSMGGADTDTTPVAVAGRVLAYPYQPRENYHAGMAVCSAPNGTVDIMTREEIRDYPDCIIGIVSEIPQYEEWGNNKISVNGRIWIKIK